MDAATLAALTALSSTHPQHAAALVGAASKPGATANDLHQLVASESAKASEAKIAELSAKILSLEGQLSDETKAKADALAAATKVKAFAGNFPADPGPAEPNATALTSEQFIKLSPVQRSAFRARGGKIADA